MKWRAAKWVLTSAAVLAMAVVALVFCLFDWSGKPFCHAQIMMTTRLWLNEVGEDGFFPDVDGSSADSLKVLLTDWDSKTADSISNRYRYVPGLQGKDPGNLVLMYFNRPTRYTTHVSFPTVFDEKGWIILPVDFGSRTTRDPVIATGECGERVTTIEFKRRLRATLDFLRTNDRPHWQKVVAEHTAFLDEIEKIAP